MLEKEVERKLKVRVQAMGGMCLKFESPGYTGVPDRIILLPNGTAAFAELKAPGRKERPLQCYVQNKLRNMGFKVFSTVSTEKDIAEVEAWVRSATQAEVRDE